MGGTTTIQSTNSSTRSDYQCLDDTSPSPTTTRVDVSSRDVFSRALVQADELGVSDCCNDLEHKVNFYHGKWHVYFQGVEYKTPCATPGETEAVVHAFVYSDVQTCSATIYYTKEGTIFEVDEGSCRSGGEATKRKTGFPASLIPAPLNAPETTP